MVYATEMVTTFRISQLSDQIGRKFVFLTCIAGLAVFMSGFGLSMTFWELMLWFVRCLNQHLVLDCSMYSQALIGAFSKFFINATTHNV